MAVLMVPPYLQFLDNNGAILNGGFVGTYSSGTDTPKATYTDNTEGTPAANPVQLDAYGRATIWVNGSYRFKVYDSAMNLLRTTDGVTSFSVPAASANAYFQSFSGTGAQTVFTASSDLGTDEKAIMVFVDAGAGKGYDLINPSAYTISATTLTFSVAPASGTNNIYVTAPSLLLGAASSSAVAAATSETNAAASAVLASQWATLTSGIVAATDYSAKAWAIGGTGVTTTSGKGAAKEWATSTGAAVDTSEFSAKEYAVGTTATAGSSKSWATLTSGLVMTIDGSAKAWAIGGTGITATSGKGAAKEWATKTSAAVDTSEFSAKEYASGTQAATGGSAKNWAKQTGADVTGAAANDRSAKSWAQEAIAGATLGGSAKDWAQSASKPDGTLESSKTYATQSAASAAQAASSAAAAAGIPNVAAGGTVDVITATYSPAITLTDKLIVAFVASGANTSATPTFAPNGLTAHTIVKKGGSALVAGDIPAALAVCLIQYNLANTRWELINPAAGASTTKPTRQTLTSGSGATYTLPASCTYIRVRGLGAGGGAGGDGGSGGSPTDGGDGGTTIFGSWTAIGGIHGRKGTSGAAGAGGLRGTGGTGGANGTGTTLRVDGSSGFDGKAGQTAAIAATPRMPGGVSVLGGSAATAVANTGNGGWNNGQTTGASQGGTGGTGGAGEYFEALIPAPAATYTYTIGAGGIAGTDGTGAGGALAGASGVIIVDEFYS